MHGAKILIIVPAFNESGNIRRTVGEILACGYALDVLVVDDGSLDQTAAEARSAGVNVVSLPFNLGIGGAVQTGFQYAFLKRYDVAVQVDGDGQHDARYLPDLFKPLEQGQADITVGSRFIGPFTGYRSSFVRRIGIHFFARLTSLLTGFKISDPTSGFRAHNRKAISIFARDYPGDFPEPESIVIARQRGLRVLEVPVQMRKRQAGHSSIRYLYTLYYMVKVTFAICLDMLKAPPRSEGS